LLKRRNFAESGHTDQRDEDQAALVLAFFEEKVSAKFGDELRLSEVLRK
jgi:hypothetical protein